MTEPRDETPGGGSDPLYWWDQAALDPAPDADPPGPTPVFPAGAAPLAPSAPSSPVSPTPPPATPPLPASPGPAAPSSVPSWGTPGPAPRTGAPTPSSRPSSSAPRSMSTATSTAGTTTGYATTSKPRSGKPGVGFYVGMAVVAMLFIGGMVRGCGSDSTTVVDPDPAPTYSQDRDATRPTADQLLDPVPLEPSWTTDLDGAIRYALDGSTEWKPQIILGESTWVVGIGEYDTPVDTLVGLDAATGEQVWSATLEGAVCADEDGFEQILCLDAPGGLGPQGGRSTAMSLVAVGMDDGVTESHDVDLGSVRSVHRTDEGLLVYSDSTQGADAMMSLVSPTGEVLWSTPVLAGDEPTTLSESEVTSFSWLELADSAVALTTTSAFVSVDPATGPVAPPVSCPLLASDGQALYCRSYYPDQGVVSYDSRAEQRWLATGLELVYPYSSTPSPVVVGDGNEYPADETLAMDWSTGSVTGTGVELLASDDDPDSWYWSSGSPGRPVLVETWYDPSLMRLTALDDEGRPLWSLVGDGYPAMPPVVTLSDGREVVLVQIAGDLAAIDWNTGEQIAVYDDGGYGTIEQGPSGVAQVQYASVSRLELG